MMLSRIRVPVVLALVLLAGCASTPRTSPNANMVGAGAEQPPTHVWVCHGGRQHKWRRVSASAAHAHQRHGDRVSTVPEPVGQLCS